MTRRFTAVLMAALCLGQSVAMAAQQVQVAWSELAPLTVDKKVSLNLADSKRVQGEMLAVRPDEVVLNIQKSSDRKLYPNGQASIPRGAFSEIRVIRDKGPGKLVGGIAGTVGGLFATVGLAVATNGAAALPALILLWPAAAVAGYYAGKALDRRTTIITIAPEPGALETEAASW